jgi:hypothetical protein
VAVVLWELMAVLRLACKENIGSEIARLQKIIEANSEPTPSNDIPEMTIAPDGKFSRDQRFGGGHEPFLGQLANR